MTYSFKISLILMITLIVFSGCTKRTMAPEEALKNTIRTYPGLAPETILSAASDLFFLADDQAFQRTQTPDHLMAIRNHSLDIGINFAKGEDTWKVKTQKTSDGTKVMLDIRSEETLMAGKTQIETPNGPATYQQFWNRLDYLLGKSTTWMTCRDLTNEYLEDRTWGDTWWLCSDLTDRTPPELIEGLWMKGKGEVLSLEENNACSGKVLEAEYGIAQTERQREVYRSLCLEGKGYRKVKLPSDVQPD